MATTASITLTSSHSSSLFVSCSHCHTYTRRVKKAANIFCQQHCAHLQPSSNLLPCGCRVFGTKVSLNLSPQSQTSGILQRNNVYFLSAVALFSATLSLRRELVYLTNSPMICASSLSKVTENTPQLMLYY